MKTYIVKNLFVDAGVIGISSVDYYKENKGILPETDNLSYIIDRKPGTYTIKYKLLGSWLDKDPEDTITITTKSGLLAIGDPCYWFERDSWDKFLDKTSMLETPEEDRLFAINTGGDGCFSIRLEIEKIK